MASRSCSSSRTRAPRCESSDYGYVLETGEVALSGPAKSLANDPRVQQTYLGGATDED